MAATALKTLRDAVKRRQFDGAYYVFGDDEYQKYDAVRHLVDAAVDLATRDFNYDVRHASDLDEAQLHSLVNTPPMMAERRAVVVRDVNALRRNVRVALDRYLKRPAPETLLILVAAAGAKEDRALAAAATSLGFDPLDDDHVARWIVQHAKTALHLEVTASAAELLASAVGSDLYQIVSELDKLASYTSGAPVTDDAVAAVVGVRRGEQLGDLLDLVLARDAARALALVPHILAQPRTTAVSVVIALTTQMLAVAWGRARMDDGLPAGRLQGEYFTLLKSTGAYPGRAWSDATRAWARAVPDWDARACDTALDALVEADVALKESRVSSEEQVLATTILALCAAGMRGRLAA